MIDTLEAKFFILLLLSHQLRIDLNLFVSCVRVIGKLLCMLRRHENQKCQVRQEDNWLLSTSLLRNSSLSWIESSLGIRDSEVGTGELCTLSGLQFHHLHVSLDNLKSLRSACDLTVCVTYYNLYQDAAIICFIFE